MKLDRITFDKGIMGGLACVRGMRITASLVINLVANGVTPKQIISEYPDLDEEDIRQCLLYASALAKDELHSIAG